MGLIHENYHKSKKEKEKKKRTAAQNPVKKISQTTSLSFLDDPDKMEKKRAREEDSQPQKRKKTVDDYKDIASDEDTLKFDKPDGNMEFIEESIPIKPKRVKRKRKKGRHGTNHKKSKEENSIDDNLSKSEDDSILDSENFVDIDDTLSITEEDDSSDNDFFNLGDEYQEIISRRKVSNSFNRIKHHHRKKRELSKKTKRKKYTGKKTLSPSKPLNKRISIKKHSDHSYIALFRGISFNPTKTSKERRKIMRLASRQKNFSVHLLTDIQQKITENIVQILKNFKIETKDISKYFKGYIGEGSGGTPHLTNATPLNCLEVLSHLYSCNYDKFMEYWYKLVCIYVDNEKLDAIQLLKKVKNYNVTEKLNQNEYRFNPVVSFGNVPLHAVKYAMGDKVYHKNYKNTLQPIYSESGKPNHPYMGILSIMLFNKSHLQHSQDITSLLNKNRVNVPAHIAAERETQFWGKVPKPEKQHFFITKYPDFSKEYNEKFYMRYGLQEKQYEDYKDKLQKVKGNAKKLALWEDVLTTHLTYFYEQKAWSIATKLAGENGLGFVNGDSVTNTLPSLKQQLTRQRKRQEAKEAKAKNAGNKPDDRISPLKSRRQ